MEVTGYISQNKFEDVKLPVRVRNRRCNHDLRKNSIYLVLLSFVWFSSHVFTFVGSFLLLLCAFRFCFEYNIFVLSYLFLLCQLWATV